jgi:hypothetical protein
MTTPGAPLPATTELLRWSTDAVEARNRLDDWVGAICECFLEMGVQRLLPESPYDTSRVFNACGPCSSCRLRNSTQTRTLAEPAERVLVIAQMSAGS